MIKLIDLIKKIEEGAKVTFDDPNAQDPNPTDIQISWKPIEGEQMMSYNHQTKKEGYTVFYSLISAPDETNVKHAQDALKYHAELINQAELKDLLGHTVKISLLNAVESKKIDYIGYLESAGNLNKALLNVMKELFNVPDENIIDIEKVAYQNIDDAVNWEKFDRLDQKTKDMIIKYLYQTRGVAPGEQADNARVSNKDGEVIKLGSYNPGPYKIKKSPGEGGSTPGRVVAQLHSKYNFGMNPNIDPDYDPLSLEGLSEEQLKLIPPIYRKLVDCILNRKTLLIIDDNIHSGDDFRKIFRKVDELAEKIRDGLAKSCGNQIELEKEIKGRSDKLKEVEAKILAIRNDLTKISRNSREAKELEKKIAEEQGKQKNLIEKIKELGKIKIEYTNRIENLTKPTRDLYKRLFGYVLYTLEDEDIKKTKQQDKEKKLPQKESPPEKNLQKERLQELAGVKKLNYL